MKQTRLTGLFARNMSEHWKQHDNDDHLLIGPPKREREEGEDDPRQREEEEEEEQTPPAAVVPRSLPAYSNPVQRLKITGATIVADPWFVANVATLVRQFDETLRNFPEYRRDGPLGNDLNYVLGGFAALGNAASWHNPFVRFLRLHAMRAVYPLFSQMTSQNREYLAELADRMLYRPANAEPTPESWHRDVKKNQARGETIYGGWINTSEEDQFLSCVLGTQDDQPNPNDPQGFEKIKDRRMIAQYERDKTLVRVKPGEILVFREEMVHEVLKVKRPYPVRRVFLAWMTTLQRDNHFPSDIDTLLRNQAVIKLKSDQMPKLYPQAYIMYFIDKLTRWSVDTFKPPMLIQKVQKADAKKLPGQTIMIARAEAPSLVEANFPLYPAYQPHEVAVFHAARTHLLPVEVGSQQLGLSQL